MTKRKPCVRMRAGSIRADEQHPCYFCGHPIPVRNEPKLICLDCYTMRCPACGKCYCAATSVEMDALRIIHNRYCCNRGALANFRGFGGELDFAPHELLENSAKALRYCSAKLREQSESSL